MRSFVATLLWMTGKNKTHDEPHGMDPAGEQHEVHTSAGSGCGAVAGGKSRAAEFDPGHRGRSAGGGSRQRRIAGCRIETECLERCGDNEWSPRHSSDEKRCTAKSYGFCHRSEGDAHAAAIVAADLPDAGNKFGAEERDWRNYLTEATCHSSADDIMRMHWPGTRSKRRGRPKRLCWR